MNLILFTNCILSLQNKVKHCSFLLLLFFFMAFVSANAQKTPDTLRFKTGLFVARNNISTPDLQKQLEKGKWGNKTYVLLVFNKPPSTAQWQRLKNNGAEILHYLSGTAYMVRFNLTPSAFVLSETDVAAAYAAPSYLKTGKELAAWQNSANTNQLTEICVLLHKGVAMKDVLPSLNMHGFSLTKSQYSNQGLLIGIIKKSYLQHLIELPFISSVNTGYFQPQTLMQRERAAFGLTGITSSQGASRNLTGAGVTVGVGENTDPTTHIDNIVNVVNRNPVLVPSNHGTHVNGVVSGDGIIEERLMGVAPASREIAEYYDYVITKTPIYITDYGVTVTNNSYFNGYSGCPGNGDYNELSVYADQQIAANPFLQHIFAAGNDGTLTCAPMPFSFGTIKSGYQTSKNVLSVGNCDIFTTGVIANTSSRGPVKDGRLKPEIIASGVSVGGPGLNNLYTNNIGTSASAPYVTGVWALLTERYKQMNGGSNPKSALLKNILCNTATDKGNPGPDYKNGFGWINPQRAADALEQTRYYSGSLSTGGNNVQVVSVPAGTKQVKVMLYWHDKEAAPMSSVALVNDLDLSVTDGSTYLPWILNPAPASVDNNATRGLDRLNNMEQVTIDNPGTSISIRVDGFLVPFGPQEFFITYDFIPADLVLLHPYGGEHFATFSTSGRQEMISWQANDNSTNPFTLEYSLDDGSNWVIIANNIPATEFRYFWSVPDVVAQKAKIRITRNSTPATSTSPGNFTIMGLPAFAATVPCEGYVDLNWTAVTGITDYEVFQLINGVLTSIATTPPATLTYRVSGLDRNTTYWFTVRGRITDSAGRRALARSAKPSASTPCTQAAFDNDLKIDTLLAPSNGRKNTGTELLATQQITVRIKNLDDVPTAGNYLLSYQVNGGPVVNELSNVVIAAGGTTDYTFLTTANFAPVNTYNIKVTVKRAGDAQTANDEKTYTIKHLNNIPVALPFTETFETTGADEYRNSFFGLTAVDRFDFSTGNNNGRLRTFINSGMAINGNRSVFLDAAQLLGPVAANQLTGTVNLTAYALTPGLRFDFKFRNQGQLKQPAAGVWMRGKDDQPWIQVYDLTTNQGELGEVKQPWVDINEVMTTAGHMITSSFQIRFDQSGETSANNGSYEPGIPDIDDGFSFDDLRFSIASNDLTVTRLVAPSTFNCAASNSAITIRIKNLTSSNFTNVPVFYRIDNGSIVAGTVPAVNANSETDYTFPTLANLSVFKSYKIDTWVKETSDDYAVNDSLNNQIVHNSPVINTYPYLQRFENNDGNFFTTGSYSSWKWGATDVASRLVLTRAANGANSWYTSLSGGYKPNELSYLYSPCFDLSTLTNPVLSFAHIVQQEDNFDFHTLEYTIDNGASWQKLGLQNDGTNWFDVPALNWRTSIQRWHVSSVDIPTTASSVRFRFIFSSDESGSREGIGIDDFHIFEREIIYTGANVININQPVSGSNWVHFTSGGNRVASINPLGQNLGATDVSVYINAAPVRFINNQYYLDRNLVIQPTNALTDSVLVRFYFTDAEFNALFNANSCGTCSKPRDAFIVGVTKFSGIPSIENGTLADNSGVYDFINPDKTDVIPYNNGYYAEFKVRSFSEFWINSGGINLNVPLPVTLLNFKGSKRFPHIDLQWQTASETNSSHFEVERKIDDETQFSLIGTVAALGNSAQTITYQFTDNQVLQRGTDFYYRLKMIDKDGKAVYSNTIALNQTNADVFVQGVYNNAGTQLFIAAGNKAGIKNMFVRILNTAGQTILKERLAYQDSKIEIGQLSDGVYILEIKDDGGKETYLQKFVKQ